MMNSDVSKLKPTTTDRFYCRIIKINPKSFLPGVGMAAGMFDQVIGQFDSTEFLVRTYSYQELFRISLQSIHSGTYQPIERGHLAKSRRSHLIRYGLSFGCVAGVIGAMNSSSTEVRVISPVIGAGIGIATGAFAGAVMGRLSKPLVRITLHQQNNSDFMLFVTPSDFENVKTLFAQNRVLLSQSAASTLRGVTS